jgi:tetratricopeptide (TPR) repeat protein
MKTRWIALAFSVILLCACAVAKRLPDEALKKAQEAEQQLKKNNPDAAVKILQELDKQYPQSAAISLRLAQIYDAQDNLGSALFYYRRYAMYAGDKPHEEAIARLQTLERTAQVPQQAEELAKKLGEKTDAYSGPQSTVSRSIASVNEKGSLVEVKGPEDLKRLNQLPELERKEAPPAVVVPEIGNESAVYAGGENAKQQSSSDQDKESSGKGQSRAPDEAEKILPDQPEPVLQSDAVPSLQAAAGYSAEAGPAGNSTGIRMSLEPAHAPETVAGQAATQPGRDELTSAMKPGSQAEESQSQDDDNGEFSSYFTTKEIEGHKSRLHLENKLGLSILTFAAVPDGGGKPVNVILANDEERDVEFDPGKYTVRISATDSSYPPRTLISKTFSFFFGGGRVYRKIFRAE